MYVFFFFAFICQVIVYMEIVAGGERERERVINLYLANSILLDLSGWAAGSLSSLPVCVFIIIAFVFLRREDGVTGALTNALFYLYTPDV